MLKKEVIFTLSVSISLAILVFFIYNFYYSNLPFYSPNYRPQVENIKDTWSQNTPFTDIQTSQQFALSDFQNKIILLNSFDPAHPFSLKQHLKIKELMAELEDNIVVISFDMSQNPDSYKTLSYLEDKGFDWRFAIPSEQNKQLLINDFGVSFYSVSSNPLIFICQDGRIIGDMGPNVKTVEQIKEKMHSC